MTRFPPAATPSERRSTHGNARSPSSAVAANSTASVSRRIASFTLAAVVLAGCATSVILLRNDSTGELARCGGNTIGSMEGRSAEQASDEACVRDYAAKGFRRTSEAEEKLRQTRAAPATPPPKPTVPVESRWLLAAESLARANGCGTPLVVLTERAAGQERFAVTCADGRPFSPVTCTFDGCRLGP